MKCFKTTNSQLICSVIYSICVCFFFLYWKNTSSSAARHNYLCDLQKEWQLLLQIIIDEDCFIHTRPITLLVCDSDCGKNAFRICHFYVCLFLFYCEISYFQWNILLQNMDIGQLCIDQCLSTRRNKFGKVPFVLERCYSRKPLPSLFSTF